MAYSGAGTSIYLSETEHERNARYLREKEERRRAKEQDDFDREYGLGKYASRSTATNTKAGVYGSRTGVDKDRDVNHWMKTSGTPSSRYENMNQARRRDTSPSKNFGRQERKSVGYTDHYTDHHETYDRNKYGDQRLQQQETIQQQRSIQASMQMAYTVFSNVITALETYEEREARKSRYRAPRKSRIPIPDQGFKNDEDVKASLMSQLKVFETHLKVCPKQVKDDVTSDMKVMVAQWLSARDDPKRFPPTKTDEYAARLFEILVKGSTIHADFSRHQKVMGKTELMGNFQKVVRGQALADDLDRSFRDDPRKTATRPDVRRGTDINKGLRRIDLCDASLSPHTKELKEASIR